MLPKSGDLKDSGNWRIILILPILYQIFSKMLYNRLLPFLDHTQYDDQIGFRPGMRIENAFATLDGLIDIAIWLTERISEYDFRHLFEA